MLALQAGCPIMSHMSWSGLFLAAAMTVASPEKEAASIISVMPPAPVVASERTLGPENRGAGGSQVFTNPDCSYREDMVSGASQATEPGGREARICLRPAFRGVSVEPFESVRSCEPSGEQANRLRHFLEYNQRRDLVRMGEVFAEHPACAAPSSYRRGVNGFTVGLTQTKEKKVGRTTEHSPSGALPALLQKEEQGLQRACLLGQAFTPASGTDQMESPGSMAARMRCAVLSHLPSWRKDRSPPGSAVLQRHQAERSALPGFSSFFSVDLSSASLPPEETRQGRGETGVSETRAQGLRLLRSAPGILWNLPEQQSCLKGIQV